MLATQKNEIIVFGASGDLAKRKIYPSLRSLYQKQSLSQGNTRIIGYGRTPMDKPTFTTHISSMMQQPHPPSDFFDICSYVSGPYSSLETLSSHLKTLYPDPLECRYTSINRMFYLSIPSTTYKDVIENIRPLFSSTGWNRVLIEKPLGRDLESFLELKQTLLQYIPASDIYCVDHYLGKSVIQHIPKVCGQWPVQDVEAIDITFSETIGIEDRKYFDEFGIIRDVVQNHLLQVCAIVLAEANGSQNRTCMFQHMQPINATECIFGQYKGYRDSPFVAKDSTTPTYFKGRLHVMDGVWDHVPITLQAGKAMHMNIVEVVITLRGSQAKIRIEVQPEASITINGETMRFPNTNAYETILNAALLGDKTMFVSLEEVECAWKTLALVLDTHVQPMIYEIGSSI